MERKVVVKNSPASKSTKNSTGMNSVEKAYIKKLINQKVSAVQELKSFDTGFSQGISSTGTLQKISTIPQGDTDSSRDGDALKLAKLSLEIQFAYADATNAMRFIIVRWNQDDSSSAPAAVTDVLQTASPFSPMNRDNIRAKKFDVIIDHFTSVCNVGPGVKDLHINKHMKSKIAFQATATTGTGHLYVFMISDSVAVNHPTISYIARVWFTDS